MGWKQKTLPSNLERAIQWFAVPESLFSYTRGGLTLHNFVSACLQTRPIRRIGASTSIPGRVLAVERCGQGSQGALPSWLRCVRARCFVEGVFVFVCCCCKPNAVENETKLCVSCRRFVNFVLVRFRFVQVCWRVYGAETLFAGTFYYVLEVFGGFIVRRSSHFCVV